MSFHSFCCMVNTGLFHVLLRPPGLQSRSLFVCYRSACARPFLTLGLYCTVFLAPCQEAILAIFLPCLSVFSCWLRHPALSGFSNPGPPRRLPVFFCDGSAVFQRNPARFLGNGRNYTATTKPVKGFQAPISPFWGNCLTFPSIGDGSCLQNCKAVSSPLFSDND